VMGVAGIGVASELPDLLFQSAFQLQAVPLACVQLLVATLERSAAELYASWEDWLAE
jgi:hypothetical protein